MTGTDESFHAEISISTFLSQSCDQKWVPVTAGKWIS